MLYEGYYRTFVVYRFRVDGRKRFEYGTCGGVFFWKTEEKNLRFQKYPDTCGGGLKLLNLQVFTCKFARSLFITRTKSKRSRKSPLLHGTLYPHGSFENNFLFSAQISLYLGG